MLDGKHGAEDCGCRRILDGSTREPQAAVERGRYARHARAARPCRAPRDAALAAEGEPITMDPYAEIREILLAKQRELSIRLENLKQNLRRGRSADSQEQAQELDNAEVVDTLGNETRFELAKIAKALDQIKNDTYGICTDCDQEIQHARMKVQPSADRCIRCATAAESASRRYARHPSAEAPLARFLPTAADAGAGARRRSSSSARFAS